MSEEQEEAFVVVVVARVSHLRPQASMNEKGVGSRHTLNAAPLPRVGDELWQVQETPQYQAACASPPPGALGYNNKVKNHETYQLVCPKLTISCAASAELGAPDVQMSWAHWHGSCEPSSHEA